MTESEKKPTPRKSVTLKKPHTHAGVDYHTKGKDDTYGKIEVTDQQARRLAELGVI